MHRFISHLLMLAIIFGATVGSQAAEKPQDLKHLGGFWYVSQDEKPVYYYKDADRFVDLFSYHAHDSNKDGIANLVISHDQSAIIIQSQGYPNHPTAIFPNSGNPNSIRVQNFQFRLPLQPRLSGKITRLPMGPIGMALNGVVFFNPFEVGGMNAVEGYSEVWLDSCCGHPQQTGVYHYHKYPSCVKSPFPDDGEQHSPIIGFAFDGFPVYGPFESDSVQAKDLKGKAALDVCNGHQDEKRGYHYHVTPRKFPYIIGGYAGVVEPANNRGLMRAGIGAITNNARGTSTQSNAIRSVKPGSASRGNTHTITVLVNPSGVVRGQLPNTTPTWMQIGPYEATNLTRKGNVITGEIKIPQDAGLGILLDCHLEFASSSTGSRPIVIKQNDAFRVIDSQ